MRQPCWPGYSLVSHQRPSVNVLGPVHEPSQVNYNELQLQFKSISSNFIGWICLQNHCYLAWLCEPGPDHLYEGGGIRNHTSPSSDGVLLHSGSPWSDSPPSWREGGGAFQCHFQWRIYLGVGVWIPIRGEVFIFLLVSMNIPTDLPFRGPWGPPPLEEFQPSNIIYKKGP